MDRFYERGERDFLFLLSKPPPFSSKTFGRIAVFADAKFLQSGLVLKGRGEPVEKDWKLKRSDTGGATAFPANFSDDSDNSDPAPPGCAVASNAHYMGRHERSGKKPTTVPPEDWWSHSIREIAVSNFRVVQVSDLLRVWGGQPHALSRRRFHPPKDERRRSESRRGKTPPFRREKCFFTRPVRNVRSVRSVRNVRSVQ